MPYFDPRQLNRAGMYSGLLRQPRAGINLLGMNLPAGRNTLVARPDDAPNAAAASAIRGYVGRNSSPQRRSVQNIFAAPRGVTDILSRLGPQKYGPGIGGIPAAPSAPTAMGGANVLARGVGQFMGRRGGADQLTDRPPGGVPAFSGGGINMPGATLQAPANQPGAAVGAPQSFMGKIGGFLKRPGMGESLMAAGARMMQGSPQGTLATIGEGLETGLGAYGEAKTARQLEEDRAIVAEERAEKARREQAARDAILGDEDLPDADKDLLITMVNSGDLAGALNRRDRIVDVAGLTTRMEGIEGLSDTDKSTVRSLARDDLGAANQFLEGRITNIDFGVLRQDAFDADDELEDPLFSSTKREWLNLLPGEMASSVIMDALADEEMRPAVWEGLKRRYYGDRPITQDQADMLDGLVDDLEVGTALLGAPIAQITSVEAADGSVQVYRSGLLIDTLPAGAAKELPPGLIESLPALKDFSDDFFATKVEYLASRTDLNKKLENASDDTFRRLNVLGYDLLALMERGGTDLAISEAQAEFLQTLNTIGFENLSLFVGPTSDFEAGLAQMIQGNLTLSRDRLKELASRQLRQRLNLWARHNDRVERAAARLPEGSFLRGEAEAHYIKLMPEDVPGFTLDEWQREMDARSGAGGGSRILFEGSYPVTGAQVERSGAIPGVTSTAGDYWNLGGGTSGGLDAFNSMNFGQVPVGSVNQMQYPWSTLPPGGDISGGGVSDFTNRQLFTPGQGLLPPLGLRR